MTTLGDKMGPHNHILDTLSFVVVVSTIVGLLPPIAALVSIIYGCIKIYESDTVQKLLKRKE